MVANSVKLVGGMLSYPYPIISTDHFSCKDFIKTPSIGINRILVYQNESSITRIQIEHHAI